jgi:hypothetical protein
MEVSVTDNDKLQRALNRMKLAEREDCIPIDQTAIWRIYHDKVVSDGGEEFEVPATKLLVELAQEGTTLCVYFAVKEKNFTKSKFDATLWEQLMLIREMQYYWSDNSVSCTVTVKKKEAPQLKSAIEAYAPYVKTLSFLPLTDHRYQQAPYTECTKEEFDGYVKDISKLHLDVAESRIAGSRFCTNDTCSI